MRFGIKENKEFVYEFRKNEELKIYSEIGREKALYQNYYECIVIFVKNMVQANIRNLH